MTDLQVQEWLRSFDHDDHGKAATAALNDLGKLSQRARALLLPILTEAVLMARRTETRRVERAVSIAQVFTGDTTIEQRRTRLAATFALPDGRRVSWAEATITDHQARIWDLQKDVAGLQKTISEHAAAIQKIKDHGVSCLAEIGEAA